MGGRHSAANFSEIVFGFSANVLIIPKMQILKTGLGTSLTVQWLKICLALGHGSIPGRGTKIPNAAEQLSPHTTTKTREPLLESLDERSCKT